MKIRKLIKICRIRINVELLVQENDEEIPYSFYGFKELISFLWRLLFRKEKSEREKELKQGVNID